MRMWMVDPKIMCNRHLLGEHAECHMLAGTVGKGKSIAGYLKNGFVEPQNVGSRHDKLAREMKRRGFRHNSLLNIYLRIEGHVDLNKSSGDLRKRCEKCSA